MVQNEGQRPRNDAELAAIFGPQAGVDATAPVRQRPGMHASRPTTYIGFYFWWWTMVTALLGLGTFIGLTQGQIEPAFIGLLLTGLSGLYVRYLYRGGRFRMIFIIF
jgi:hypothetical protein